MRRTSLPRTRGLGWEYWQSLLVSTRLQPRLGCATLTSLKSSVKYDEIPSKSLETNAKGLHVVTPLGQNQRTSPRFQRSQDIVKDRRVARFISPKGRVDRRHRQRSSFQFRRQREYRVANANFVKETSPQRLGSWVHSMTHRTALHEDDGLVSDLSSHGRRQSDPVTRFGSLRHRFETCCL